MGLLGLMLLTTPAWSVDYSKIDRSLKKEPKYSSKTPKYALLVFGREANLRVWVVLDGETLYVDRNGDGDLTAANERFRKGTELKDVEIADPDGKTRYILTSIGVHKEEKPPSVRIMPNVDIKGPLEYRQYGDAELRTTPKEATIAHFHGPLTAGPRTILWKVPPDLKLITGDKPIELNAVVGTMSAEHGCWVVVRSHNGEKSAFARGVHPAVEIEFPAKTPGGPTVKKRYLLDKFC
jgi:hypothetical protein